MSRIAYIFPGQGAQYVGMGQDFYQRLPRAKETFEQANDVLGFDLSGLIFKGPLEELTRTAYCQPAVLTVSIACLRALEEVRPGMNIAYAAGLSLGEYSALTAAGAIGFEETLRLVDIRARGMEEAGRQNPGGMLSVIGLSLDGVEKVCSESGTEVANLNCPGQVVISGDFAALEKAAKMAQAAGAAKVVSLKVGGAFHSSLMEPAKEKLVQALEKITICPGRIPVVSNVTAGEVTGAEQIKDNLARQVCSRVRWEDSVRFIASQGVTNFIEIGPGRILKGLLRKIDPALRVYNIEKIADLEGRQAWD